jgi:hypothetical protein
MKFVHFGCWNNGLCSESGTNGLSIMTKKLNEYILTNSIEFLTVAGDNYYPKKELTGKKFNDVEFNSGFECLPKQIKKYLIFGNHDIDDIIVNDEGVALKCKILEEQIKKAEDNNTFEIFNDVLHKIIGNTLIIMFDSNLYEEDKTKFIRDTCYNKLFNSFVEKSELKIKDLIDYQNTFISDLITTNPTVKNIIFIAHHPIYSIKSKIKNSVEIKDDYETTNLIIFLKNIQELLVGKKIYHLCADTHIYQEGIIILSPTISIKQYIVGTGGASQDNIYSLDNTILKDDVVVYRKFNEKKEFGFLEVEILDDDVKCNFISASVMRGGGLKKYKILKK